MRVLIIGGGGREHALAWKLRQSHLVSRIWCAPGNGGISQQAECVSANLGDVCALAELAETLKADLTVVGPEQPLVDGIADEFARRGLRIIGPSKRWAQLEGSKVFAKRFLNDHNIPTAEVRGIFSSIREANKASQKLSYPVVLKADGLCGGKGVLVAKSYSEASDFADRALGKREFGNAGDSLLIEEALEGSELSFIVLCDGRDFVSLVPTRDHKRAFDGDVGPNTGGMGAFSCDGIISSEIETQIRRLVVEPTMEALTNDDDKYRGFLYFGLMLTPDGPKVLEFNCRLGDPETQGIMARMDSDLGEVLVAAAQRKSGGQKLSWHPGASVCVVMASGGYPGKYEAGKQIHGLEKAGGMEGVAVFHAGTRRQGEYYYTSSGRVLGVTGTGTSLEVARRKAYDAVREIQFMDCHFRRDIALQGCRAANMGED
jgi:phosphoribosylamine---glycine ligase